MSIHSNNLPIVGMTCHGCVSSVARALRAVRGVQDVKLELPPGTARVAWDLDETGLVELIDSVRGAGYDVATDEITLQVAGMSCARCVLHVTSALEDVPGVVRAGVDLKAGRAVVTGLREGVEAEDLIKALRQAGYEAQEFAAHARPA